MSHSLSAARALSALCAAAVLSGCAAKAHNVPVHASGRAAGTASPAAVPPVITAAGARQVLAQFTAANNKANQARSDRMLASYEAGSSYALDKGNYRWTKVTDPAGSQYIAAVFTGPAFYIPRAGSGAAAWWVTRATWTPAGKSASSPPTPQYLVFSRASPGRWMEVLEPYAVPGAGPVPPVAADAAGYASAPGSAQAAQLAVPPGQLPSLTAAYLDGHPAGLRLTGASNLTDLHDQAFWQSRLPQGSTDDQHSVTADPVYALRTADGGALLWYDLTARLTLAPPGGQSFRVQIPGFYSASQTETSASVGYAEQFCVYDPPRGQGSPRLVADTSGIASRG